MHEGTIAPYPEPGVLRHGQLNVTPYNNGAACLTVPSLPGYWRHQLVNRTVQSPTVLTQHGPMETELGAPRWMGLGLSPRSHYDFLAPTFWAFVRSVSLSQSVPLRWLALSFSLSVPLSSVSVRLFRNHWYSRSARSATVPRRLSSSTPTYIRVLSIYFHYFSIQISI